MHNNYYFLRQLAPSLAVTLRHAVVSECFSQNKNELVLRFEIVNGSFFIKASLSSSFSCLSFPPDFHRARKNSIDLFKDIVGQRVIDVHPFSNERSFSINFSNDVVFLFKLHGNRSNLILFIKGVVVEIFKNNIVEDESLKLSALDRSIDWSFEHFQQNRQHPESVYFTFGKLVWKYLRARQYDKLSGEQQWQLIQNVRQQLENPTYLIQEEHGQLFLSLLDVGHTIKVFGDPIQALQEFYLMFTFEDTFRKEKSSAISFIKSTLHSTENYIRKTETKLRALQDDNHYKVWADVLMANLHVVKSGVEVVTLPDFYHDNHPIDIRLKRDLSPQDNAAIFYKKGKNQTIEINHLTALIERKRQESILLANQLAEAEDIRDVKLLRKLTDRLKVYQEKEKQKAPLPYREVEHSGFKIWIGRNAASNDVLTLKFGYKDDLWLHAKDVAGSHVLVKYQAGKKFPKDVVERAAQLAAYHSKRKNETLCPVSVTPRKYVRKRKGDPPGAVIVEREEVMMVVPAG